MGKGCPGGKLTDSPASPQPQVKLLEVMEGVDKETFEFKFGKELTFTTVLSDQQVVELIPGGTGIVVEYEDRSRFIQLVRKARLEESKEQVGELVAGGFLDASIHPDAGFYDCAPSFLFVSEYRDAPVY